jgi:hypothetical protein
VVACVTGDLDTSPARAPKKHRVCVSIDHSGFYRDEPSRQGPSRPRLQSIQLPTVSGDASLSFGLSGGARNPHAAVGTLRDARSGRVLKQAPVEYDEHAVFLGWVGQGVVFKSWVEEGPGCGLRLFDIQKTWPDLRGRDGVALGSCYTGYTVLRAGPGQLAIFDGQGAEVTVVNESTFAVTSLKAGWVSGDVEDQGQLVAWLEKGAELVLVYGAPTAGAVVRVDLKQRTVLERWRAPACTGW